MRVLIQEPSRYRSLLLRRALAAHFPEAVVARFETSEQAIFELKRNSYNVVIGHFGPEMVSISAATMPVFEADLMITLFFEAPPGDLNSAETHQSVVWVEAKSGFETEVMTQIESHLYQTSDQVLQV